MYAKGINILEIVVMKKISLLLAAILASVTVSGCDAFSSFFGGDSSQPQDQQKSDDDSKKEDNGNSDPWEQEEQETDYAVTFDNNEGSGNMAIQTTDGSEFVVPECTFTRAGYHFIKWGLRVNEEWTYYSVGDKITGIKSDIILYAIWEEDSAASYTVTLDANNGTGEYITATTTGSIFVAPSCSFTYSGHSFNGWALNSPSGTKYASDSTISDINSNITLYATWQQNAPTNYTVSFNPNGGLGTMSNQTTSGSSYKTPACTYTKTNYTFSKWALNSTSGTQYAEGDTISGISANIILYAIWTYNGSSGGDPYYAEAQGLTGSELLGKLHDISIDNHTNYNSYSGDVSPTNCLKTDPYDSTHVMDLYTGSPMNNTTSGNPITGQDGWNREHVWPKACSNGLWGTTGGGADIQHVRPSIPKINSNRSSRKYGELNNSGTVSSSIDANGTTVIGGYYNGSDTNGTFQPIAEKKGDCARIIMYVYMHYNTYSNVHGTKDTDGKSSYFGTLNFTDVMAPSSESAAIQLLLTWNAADPVDAIEQLRNEEAAKITGCRNPFIDHEEYANRIWGTTNS